MPMMSLCEHLTTTTCVRIDSTNQSVLTGEGKECVKIYLIKVSEVICNNVRQKTFHAVLYAERTHINLEE